MITLIQNSSLNGFNSLSRTAFYIHRVAYFLLAMHIRVFLGALSSLRRPVLQSPLETGRWIYKRNFS